MARKAINTLVTGLPRVVAAAFSAAAGASVGAGSGRNSTEAASAAATSAEKQRGEQDAMCTPGVQQRPASFCPPQARRRAEQQRARQPAADRGLSQGHVGGAETHPREGEQEPVGDKAGDRGKGLASGYCPDRDAQHDGGEHDLERQCDGHAGGPVAARGIRNELGDGRPRDQREEPNADQLGSRHAGLPPAAIASPSTTKPRPRLSALVSA